MIEMRQMQKTLIKSLDVLGFLPSGERQASPTPNQRRHSNPVFGLAGLNNGGNGSGKCLPSSPPGRQTSLKPTSPLLSQQSSLTFDDSEAYISSEAATSISGIVHGRNMGKEEQPKSPVRSPVLTALK